MNNTHAFLIGWLCGGTWVILCMLFGDVALMVTVAVFALLVVWGAWAVEEGPGRD